VFRRRPAAEGPPAAPAATLVALFEQDGDARVVLTRRAQTLPVHAGEVSFPGGRVEAGEAMVDAALREAHEEVGLSPEAVEVVGWLDRVVGRSSGSVATPVVGILAAPPQLVPQPAEVEAVFDVALADLLADGVYREERWAVPVPAEAGPARRLDRSIYFFELPHDTVWGMTARILRQLLTDLTGRRAPPPGAPAPGPAGGMPPVPA
jgi:8-oxo-dGTP pyrophosphatase MutT (NUDIX family)